MANVVGRREYNVQSGSIIRNVAPSLFLIDGDVKAASFLALVEMLPKSNTLQEQFSWDIDTFASLTDTTTATSTAGATTIDVPDGTNFLPNQMWKVQRTGEIIYINSIATNVLTVTRSMTTTAAAAIVVGDVLVRLAPAVGESSTRQSTHSTTPTRKSNYCQMVRYDISLSDRQIKREFDTGDELPYQHMKGMKEARMSLDRMYLYGEQSRATIGGQDVTTTDGIDAAVATNSWAVGGTMYEYDFDEFLVEQAFRHGSSSKIALASTQAILAISQMTKDRVQLQSANFEFGQTSVGIEVLRYQSPSGGVLTIMEDRNMTEIDNGSMFILDMPQLKKREFSNNGRDGSLHMIPDTQNPDDIGNVLTIYGDQGLEYGAEIHHAKISGITGGAMKRATI